MYPKPDYLFYFQINPKTSYKRKGELTIKVLESRDKMLSDIARVFGAIQIDANKDIKTVTKDILKHVNIYA